MWLFINLLSLQFQTREFNKQTATATSTSQNGCVRFCYNFFFFFFFSFWSFFTPKTTTSKENSLRILEKMKFDGQFLKFLFRISTLPYTFCSRHLWVIDQLNESKFLQNRLNIKSFLNGRCAWSCCRYYLNSVLFFVGCKGRGEGGGAPACSDASYSGFVCFAFVWRLIFLSLFHFLGLGRGHLLFNT